MCCKICIGSVFSLSKAGISLLSGSFWYRAKNSARLGCGLVLYNRVELRNLYSEDMGKILAKREIYFICERCIS